MRVEGNARERSFEVTGELDMASAAELLDALEPAIEGEGDLLLDLSRLDFIDSTGIHVLIRVATDLTGRGCLILSSPTPPVAKVFELVRVGTFPNIHLENGSDDRPAG